MTHVSGQPGREEMESARAAVSVRLLVLTD